MSTQLIPHHADLLQPAGWERSITGASPGDEAAYAFQTQGVYPVTLASSGACTESIDLFARWMSWYGWSFEEGHRPWLPVGRIGPAMILGHCTPGLVPPPLPLGCFQPVLLGEEDYERQLHHCVPLLRRAGQPCWEDGGVIPPRARFPEKFILPASERAGLQFLVEYFPHEPGDLKVLLSILTSGGRSPAPLPSGYSGALHLVLRRGAVADLSSLQVAEASEQRVPLPQRGQLEVVSEYGYNLWVASPTLPQRSVEDQLLNDLGEGWRVHFLLCEEGRSGLSPGDEQTPHDRLRSPEHQASRQRVRIETRSELRASPMGSRGSSVPGEIRLSEREIADLDRYDPRRPDRDPVKVFLRELSAAVLAGASDLHIEPGLERARVRARIDGVLEEWLDMSVEFGQLLVGAAKELVGLSAERFLPQDGACTVHHGSEVVSVRVASYPIRKRRQKLVLRFLPKRGSVPSLDLILPMREARLLRRAGRSPYGLILFCGPTGSGKTTTVFSMLSELNTPDRNITTMEDPVEYELEGINQAELDTHRSVTWEPLLKGFLRQDPDAGLIGEIRDRATAETAIRQALTGHVVFATLHTISCAQTVERLIDMGVNADMLASALTLVVSQRLVRCLCPHCRVRAAATAQEKTLFEKHGLMAPPELWHSRSTGCPACRQGYKGRRAAVEMLPVAEEEARLIEGRARARDFSEWSRSNGFPSVYEAALSLAADGATSLAEACEWQSVWEDYTWKES